MVQKSIVKRMYFEERKEGINQRMSAQAKLIYLKKTSDTLIEILSS